MIACGPEGGVTLLRVRIVGDPEEFMKRVLAKAEEAGAEVLVVDDGLVFGEDHIRSAVHHAQKAIDEGRNSSDSLAMETLLYASGERQLGHAIRKMSLKKGSSTAAIAVLKGTLEPEGLWEKEEPLDRRGDIDRLRAFGITEEELRTVRPERAIDLVLERVAAVDVIKK